MAEVILDRVSKVYGGDTVAVREMNLDISDGEFMVFVGPSGCGKSTALRMIAGLEEISSGEIQIGDRVVNNLSPRERDVAMVFQNYALYPHMNVRDNMAFALKLKKVEKSEIERRVADAAKILGIESFLDRKPRALSGGQRQRVALGRAIVREPTAFLMDEPLSNLDAKLRVQMRTEISNLHNRLGTTTIYVTHDQTEAMTMADRIVVLKDGVVQQVATPQQMYEHPANVFVAGFIGSPAMNFLRGRVEKKEGRLYAVFGSTSVALSQQLIKEARKDVEQYAGKEVIIGIRPEHMEDAAFSRNGEGSHLEVRPTLIESMGSEKYLYFGLPREEVAHTGAMEEMVGTVGSADDTLVARVSAESKAVRDQEIRLTIEADKIHLFDPQTEETIV